MDLYITAEARKAGRDHEGRNRGALQREIVSYKFYEGKNGGGKHFD